MHGFIAQGIFLKTEMINLWKKQDKGFHFNKTHMHADIAVKTVQRELIVE